MLLCQTQRVLMVLEKEPLLRRVDTEEDKADPMCPIPLVKVAFLFWTQLNSSHRRVRPSRPLLEELRLNGTDNAVKAADAVEQARVRGVLHLDRGPRLVLAKETRTDVRRPPLALVHGVTFESGNN